MKQLALAVLIESILPACLGVALVACLTVKVARAQLRSLVE